jgi:hypothetical protein
MYFSGPKDHVFVNFVDHGGPGILGFGSKMVNLLNVLHIFSFKHDISFCSGIDKVMNNLINDIHTVK